MFADHQNALISIFLFRIDIYLLNVLDCQQPSCKYLVLIEVDAREPYRDDESRRDRRRRGNCRNRRLLQRRRGEDLQEEYFAYDVYLSLQDAL